MLIPLHKGKGDVKKCANYKSLKIIGHSMKVMEKVFEEQIQKKVEICDSEMGFMPG